MSTNARIRIFSDFNRKNELVRVYKHYDGYITHNKHWGVGEILINIIKKTALYDWNIETLQSDRKKQLNKLNKTEFNWIWDFSAFLISLLKWNNTDNVYIEDINEEYTNSDFNYIIFPNEKNDALLLEIQSDYWIVDTNDIDILDMNVFDIYKLYNKQNSYKNL
jgi:hypothetical protein